MAVPISYRATVSATECLPRANRMAFCLKDVPHPTYRDAPQHSTVVCLFPSQSPTLLLLLMAHKTVTRRFIPGGRRLIPTSESHRGFTCWAFYAHRQSSGTSTRFSISPQHDVAPVSITGPDVSFQAARRSIPSSSTFHSERSICRYDHLFSPATRAAVSAVRANFQPVPYVHVPHYLPVLLR